MRTNFYDCPETLIENIVEDYYAYKYKNEEDFFGVSIVGHYEIIIELLNELVKRTKFRFYNIEIDSPEVDGYEDEYIISIDSAGDIRCQTAKYGGNYIYAENNIIYVHNDVNSKFIIRNKGANMVAFTYDADDFTNDDNSEYNTHNVSCKCDKCNERKKDSAVNISKDKDGKLHGFSASRSEGNNYYGYSFYTSEDMDEVLISNLLKEFGF